MRIKHIDIQGVIRNLRNEYNKANGMPAPTLITQTTYAELLERCAMAAFADSFPETGTFTPKDIKGRRYWYFQLPTEDGRKQRYVGPETAELLERISQHKKAKDDERERRSMVATLFRQGFPRPDPDQGRVIGALAKAGIFRLRSVLVGTVAYQTYAPMLGERLPRSTTRTGDIDIAQFRDVSVAMEDHTPAVLDILKEVDQTFRPIPHVIDGRRVTTYEAKCGLRVDFLTPNRGRETEKPQLLPALQADAQPLRFLDFLIAEPVSAVVLHDDGIYVNVPAPERCALHKLIISRRRPGGAVKRDKDLQQAGALLEVLAASRPNELALAWQEAVERGKKWKTLILEGASRLAIRPRDLTLRTVKATRSIVPNASLTFQNPPPRYDFDSDVIVFTGSDNGETVRCEIAGETLEDYFPAQKGPRDGSKRDRIEAFLGHRSTIESMAQTKYLSRPVEEPGLVFLKPEDVPQSASGGQQSASAKRPHR